MNHTLFNGLSFIIPAFNEQDNIGATLQSIKSEPLSIPYEIIVVDHCSTDNTASIAEQHGAKVISKKGGTIASVRNLGVKNSQGKIIVFLDADVSLTPQWFQSVNNTIELLNNKPLTITGSFCTTPGNNNWLEKFWFNNLIAKKITNYLGTGHMIVSRELFELNNGFDEALSTGEDYSFCMQAIKNGGSIINNADLRVIHRDYPKTSLEFINREAWHGTGDVTSIKNILQSKVAIASLIFISMHVVFFVSMLSSFTCITVLSFLGVTSLLLLSSISKFSHCNFQTIIVNSFIYYLYYIGRSISFIKIMGINLDGHKR